MGGRVGRYMLRLLARPLAATLLLVLPALLLERLLRLFGLLAGVGSPASSIVELLIYLLPHYLGLAIPAALFLSVYLVVARLTQDHELDALQAVGFSLARLSVPFLLVGLLCATLAIGLYGYAQPYGRHAYRAALHGLTQAGWNATLLPGEFNRIGQRLTVFVERRDPADGLLHGIVVHQRREDGSTVLTTAATGRLLFSPANQHGEREVWIDMQDGQQLTLSAGDEASTLRFADSSQTRPFVQRLPMFRPRGLDERELTLDELWHARALPDPPVARGRLDGELHGRLARSASLLVMPLLAMPMGLAARRSRRSLAILLGAVILVGYQQALQLVESLGDAGRLDPRPGLWILFALFAAFSVLVFRHSNRHPEQAAFDGVLGGMDRAASMVAGWLPRRARPAV
jgi:lipopolysaccharide export system permease protein